MGFYEVFQFAEYDLAQHSTVCSSDGSSASALAPMIGPSPVMFNPDTAISGSSASVTFSLQHVSDIADVWMYTEWTSQIKVTLIDDTGVE